MPNDFPKKTNCILLAITVKLVKYNQLICWASHKNAYDRIVREILYKGKDQIAWKQLWRPKGRQFSNMKQFVFIIVSSILLNKQGWLNW